MALGRMGLCSVVQVASIGLLGCGSPSPPGVAVQPLRDASVLGSGDGRRLFPGLGPPPAGGVVGPGGGTVDRLAFVVWGDSRPANLDDTAGYPSDVLTSILQQANGTPAQFAVATGDYMFARAASAVDAQMGKLLAAEQVFSHPIFHTMGNHECTGATVSNCPNGTETPNVIAYLTRLVPFTQNRPYYAFTVQTSLGDAKFVFVAANAWDAAGTQAAWLESQLLPATRYTFVFRHEAPYTTQVPGVVASNPTIHAHPLTIGFYGHSHEYKMVAGSKNEVVSGNAGAPLSNFDGPNYYGFLYVEQRTDGAIEVREYRQDTGQVIDDWVVTPEGVPTQ